MKKLFYLIIICILFIPCLVNAETCDNAKVSISSITMENKSDNVEEINETIAKDKNINLNLNMSNVGDNIKYRIIIKNDSSDDYLLNKNSIKVSSNYIDYSIESSDNNNIVKAKTAKAFYLNVLYKNQVPNNLFSDGSIDDNVTMKLNLSSEKVENPNTGIKYYIFILFVIITMIVMFILFRKKRKNNRFEFLIISFVLLIPIGVKALCSVDININSNIKIDKPIVCGSFENDSWSDISYNVRNGNDSCYSVGDTKEVELEGFGTHTVRIANKSTPDECFQNGFSQTSCGFVVEFADIVTLYQMNPKTDEYPYGFTIGGWRDCKVRGYLNNEFINVLPTELQQILIDTRVISDHGPLDNENFITNDKIYLLSSTEIYNIKNVQFLTASLATRQLDYYKNKRVRASGSYWYSLNSVEKKYNDSNYKWWLRTISLSDPNTATYIFSMVGNRGDYSGQASLNENGVSPAFRIG